MAPKSYSQPKPEGDLEDTPSLTTLRAELSGVHVQSFKSTSGDWDPRKSRKDRLKQNTDQRARFLPSRLQEEDVPDVERASFSCSDLDRDPSLTSLRSELSDVHAKPFQPATGDWDPRRSKLERLKNNTDQRPRRIPSQVPPGQGP